MKLDQPYKCDVCAKMRESDANRWWLLWMVTEGIPPAGLLLGAWDPVLAEREDVKHACGEDCAQKLVQRWMQTSSFEAPSSRPVAPGAARGAE